MALFIALVELDYPKIDPLKPALIHGILWIFLAILVLAFHLSHYQVLQACDFGSWCFFILYILLIFIGFRYYRGIPFGY